MPSPGDEGQSGALGIASTCLCHGDDDAQLTAGRRPGSLTLTRFPAGGEDQVCIFVIVCVPGSSEDRRTVLWDGAEDSTSYPPADRLRRSFPVTLLIVISGCRENRGGL